MGFPRRYPWALFPLLTSFVVLTFNLASSCSITAILSASEDSANGGNFKASIKINFWRTLFAKILKKLIFFQKPQSFLQCERNTPNSLDVFEWISAFAQSLWYNLEMWSPLFLAVGFSKEIYFKLIPNEPRIIIAWF